MHNTEKYRKITAALYFYWLIHIRKKIPVIVYQMGKVGSLSIKNSLEKAGISPLFHVHRMNPVNIQDVHEEYLQRNQKPQDESLGLFLCREIGLRKIKAKVISSFREPIGRNISAFFQNLEIISHKPNVKDNANVQDLILEFLSKYPHHVPLHWFDIELGKVLDINVYAYPFPKDRGYLIIRKNKIDLLILKLEVPDAIKELAISEFLQIDDFHLLKKNIGEEKEYSSIYQNFKRNIKLPSDYVDLMMNSKFTRHFYTDSEIIEFKNRWQNS
jgi:hypothetical protein